MFLIITKDNTRYTIDSFKEKENGIIFEYNNELVFLDHKNIKVIDGSYSPVNAKTYMKNK